PYEEVPAKKGWVAPIGKRFDGLVWHNFDHVPHMTVAGTTRFGKTVFLKVLMTYLIEHHPDDVELYLIDLKGGLEFGPYERLKQVKKVASNAQEGAMLLTEVHERMERMYKYFRHNGWTNVIDTPEQKRIFIIIDEAAQLAPEKWMTKDQKELLGMCQYFLGEITRLGGALGFREVFCTQYPTSDTLPRSVKQNSDAKVSFRLPSGYASQVAIDDYGAEELPSNIKGRALFKTHELREM
ncbi:FtsK/SpoIIIE domain-containing protein, partial [Klebsiella pneumoniae]